MKNLKFVSLHNHTGFSLYDGLGSPEDYVDWNLKNAGDMSVGFAITDHGNMNSVGYIAALQKKIKTKGIPQKIIFGNEAYVLPSIKEWKELKDKHTEEKKLSKETKQTEEDESEDLLIENETESKAKYFSNPLNKRNHLVIVAANQTGLKNLFALTSRSYREGFYVKPRMDYDMLRQHKDGLVVSSACIAGIPSSLSYQSDDLETVMKLYEEQLLPLADIFGKDHFFLELQFNKLPHQQTVNKHLIEFSKRSGYKLIVTADAHFADAAKFRDREIYKMLGYQMKKHAVDLSILDKKISDLECELYLKNGDQIFHAYKETLGKEFDDDQLIIDAIERTHDIATQVIGNVSTDESIKLPKTFIETDVIKTPFDKLKQLTMDGLKQKGLDNNKEYIDRAVYELKVMKKLNVAEYFLALKEMLDVVRKQQLTGVARGSGGGSLINYILNITFIDPLKHNLLFERFMSPSRQELPDIDSDIEDKDSAFEKFQEHFGKDNVLSISNWNRLQLKSLIKDISKLYDIPFQEVNDITKVVDKESKDGIMEEVGNDQKLYELTYERALKYSPSFRSFIEKYPHLGERITNLYREIKACFSDRMPILTSNGYKTIKEITSLDVIAYMSNSGIIRYNYNYSVIFNGQEELFEIELEDSSILELTSNHEVLTNRGYVAVRDLQSDDKIVCTF